MEVRKDWGPHGGRGCQVAGPEMVDWGESESGGEKGLATRREGVSGCWARNGGLRTQR